MTDHWSDEELAAAVDAYREMEWHEAARKKYSKREMYRQLAERFSRSEKAFEYRMQNISAVLDDLGRDWLPGLKPAGNVGSNVRSRIVEMLEIRPNRRPLPEMAAYKKKVPAMRDWLIAVARDGGVVRYGEVMAAFGIDRLSLRHAMDFLGHQSENLGEPIITALIVSKKDGRCSQGFEKEFGIKDDQSERNRLYEFWKTHDNQLPPRVDTEPTDLETAAARFVSVEARPDQAAFRNKVFHAYKGKCVISGCDVEKALDAAHKHGRDWRKGHNSAEDGYLLRKDLHALYDHGLLRISEKGKVNLDASIMEHYKQFADVIVSNP